MYSTWFSCIDAIGVGDLIPGTCRNRIKRAAQLMAPLPDPYLTYVEFPLTGDAGCDITFTYNASGLTTRLSPDAIQALTTAGLMSDYLPGIHAALALDNKSVYGYEFDTSDDRLDVAASTALPSSFHVQGYLPGNLHPAHAMLQAFGRQSESRCILEKCAYLARAGYSTALCGLMLGRPNTPVRITGAQKRPITSSELLKHLADLGFPTIPVEMERQMRALVDNCDHSTRFTLYLDVMPDDGTLGQTLGLEFSNLRTATALSYRHLQLACAWNLADSRWRSCMLAAPGLLSQLETDNADQATRADAAITHAAQCMRNAGLYANLNTLKFCWCAGKACSAKIYIKLVRTIG